MSREMYSAERVAFLLDRGDEPRHREERDRMIRWAFRSWGSGSTTEQERQDFGTYLYGVALSINQRCHAMLREVPQ